MNVFCALDKQGRFGGATAGQGFTYAVTTPEGGKMYDAAVLEKVGLRAEAMRIVLRAAGEQHLAIQGLTRSPIEGGQGNREFLGHFTRGPVPDPTEWEQRITTLAGDSHEHDADPRANGAA